MKAAFRIGRLFGIDIKIHVTFFLILAWVLAASLMAGGTALSAAGSLLFVLAIFGCVVLHELGHALAARSFGVGTKDIVLLPIGGVARLDRIPERPREEFWIAIAGPLVNVGIALALSAILWITGSGFGGASLSSPSFLEQLIAVNIFLVLFNMLPAFPLDGGRVLRSALAVKWPYHKATRWAALGGRAFAVLFVILGLFGNIFLAIIGVFLWLAAGQEARRAELKAMIGHVPVSRAMLEDVPILDTSETVSHALRRAIAGTSEVLPVARDGRLFGTVPIQRLVTAPPESSVGALVIPNSRSIRPDEPLDESLERLVRTEYMFLPVVDDDGAIVGALTYDRVHRFYEYARRDPSGALARSRDGTMALDGDEAAAA